MDKEKDVIYLVDSCIGDNSHEYYATSIKELKELFIRTFSDYPIISMEIDTQREVIEFTYDRYGTPEDDSTNYSTIRKVKETKVTVI
tara:strand:- start:147 stop:407 length:261 start_codon:yes stop_codon:yes gene_type:complete